ncbi:hypothetical protein ACFQH1_11255 [Lactiplantibacillus daoliensis]|uniref:Integral membrane protein n=1 Tax=Lactiplantibacillus daoliensis TaxID=2559916 RepID=A0ABW1UJE4_9LACO|nr:hypothetical protein [Lactiplantibacillus daoliensis]
MNFIMTHFSGILELLTAIIGFLQVTHARKNDRVIQNEIRSNNFNTNNVNGNNNTGNMSIAQTIISTGSSESNDKEWRRNKEQHGYFFIVIFIVFLIVTFMPLFYQSGKFTITGLDLMHKEYIARKSLILFIRCVSIFSFVLLINYWFFRKPWIQKQEHEISILIPLRIVAAILWTLVPFGIAWLSMRLSSENVPTFILIAYVISLFWYLKLFYNISILNTYYFFKKSNIWTHVLAWVPTIVLLLLI